MLEYVNFEEVLKLFEENGWKLERIWPPYRVFINPKDKNSLPFLIPLEGKKVHERYYQKVKQFFEKTGEES